MSHKPTFWQWLSDRRVVWTGQLLPWSEYKTQALIHDKEGVIRMPTATEELRDKMLHAFGDIDVTGPEQWLKHRGYKLTKQWTWIVPPNIKPTHFDNECVDFLFQEWDYGGFEPATSAVAP